MVNDLSPKTCFLCGIGGSGMSALAALLQSRGWIISGSDRSRDRGETPEKFAAMAARGFRLFPQDGSGVTEGTDLLIVSSAVEDSIPDVRAAREKGVPIKKRAEVLAGLFNAAPVSIGIGGTSGKSTVTAMTGWILSRAGKDPAVVNGACMANFDGTNCVPGQGPFVAELDESDGSIALFNPSIAVVTNISLDHKPLAELEALFGAFKKRAGSVVSEGPQPLSFMLSNPDMEFSARDVEPRPDGVLFTVRGVPVTLRVPGRHNVANALAAVAAAYAAGVDTGIAAAALADYRGIKRRFEFVGVKNGITVIDDFAHNPDKIAATLRTLHEQPGRVIAVFQPHGFGPTKLMRADLVKTFAAELAEQDILLMPEIYYAGGTAQKDISSRGIAEDICMAGKNAEFFDRRADIIPRIAALAAPRDRVVVMGARDDTLPAFASAILSALP